MAVPTLQRLAVATLIRFRDALGDIGYAPVELLHDVLAACSPQQLATIEDETLAGTGRNLKPWTWPLWHEHWRRQFAGSFGAPGPADLPPLPPAAEVAAGEPGVQPADYRALYERCQAELEQKRAQSGARLRALREQAEQERQARHTQVVDPGTVPGRRRRQQQRPGPASSGGGGSSASHRSQLQPAGSSKDRLLKKLGLGGGSSRHAAAQPRKTVTIIHPPRKPTAAGLPQQQPHAAQQAVPSPSVLRQRLPHGLPISPAGSLASVGSSPLPWQQLQAGRSSSTPVRQQLQAASSSPLGQQQAQQQYGAQQQRQQQVAEHQAQRQQVAQLRQQHIEQQRRQQQQQQQQQQKYTVLKPTEAGTKPQLVTAAKVKLQVAELCTSEVLQSSLAGLGQQQAPPLLPTQQAPLQPGTHGAPGAAKRKPARPAKPQALEEVDLFAEVEEAPVQPRPPPQSVSQPHHHKRAAEHSTGGSTGGGSRGAQPTAKKPRQQQAAVPLVEVDLFDGL